MMSFVVAWKFHCVLRTAGSLTGLGCTAQETRTMRAEYDAIQWSDYVNYLQAYHYITVLNSLQRVHRRVVGAPHFK